MHPEGCSLPLSNVSLSIQILQMVVRGAGVAAQSLKLSAVSALRNNR